MAETNGHTMRAIPGIGYATMQLYNRLKDGKTGDIIPAAELTELCGKDITPSGNGYQNLCSAKRLVLRLHRRLWQWQRDAEELKCLSDSEIVEVASDDRRRMHRAAGRTLTKLAAIEPDKISAEEQKRVRVMIAVVGTLRVATSTKAEKEIAQTEAPKALDLGKLLNAIV